MIALALAAAVVFRPADPAHTLLIETTKGRVFVELRPELAPKSVARVEALVRRGVYDGLQMHRVLAGRFVQTGNPNNKDGGGTELPNLPLEVYSRLEPGTLTVATHSGDGRTGFLGAQPWVSWQPQAGENAPQAWGAYCEGVMGMGRQRGPDTGNSEIFITFRPERGFDHDYAVVGRVIAGLDGLKTIAVGEPPAAPDRMLHARLLADLPAAERPTVDVEDTGAAAFRARIAAARKLKAADFSICDVPAGEPGAMTSWTLGVIGGSGLYAVEGLEDARWVDIASPWGAPSDAVLHGRLEGVSLRFLPRHGRGHRLSPSHLNYRANIDVLKRSGATDVLSVSAVGSLREGLAPGAFVAVDQFIDRTVARETSFFGEGLVAHVSMADPVCHRLTALAAAAAQEAGASVTVGGTYLVMEGPQFSTRAESRLYRQWGCDVIGMTNMPEAKLAREAELPYASLAMVTDYDSWREEEGGVEVGHILKVMHANAALAKATLRRLCALLAERPRDASPIDTVLDSALITPPEHRDPALRSKLGAVRDGCCDEGLEANMTIELEPVGWVRGGRMEAIDDEWGAVEAEIELAPHIFDEALQGLEAFSHALVVFHFHRIDPASVATTLRHPRGNTAWPACGVFAQRGSPRPNRLGVTTCEVVCVDGRWLHVRGLDAIDGAPVLDIKPVISGFEPRGRIRQPAWADEIMAAYW